MKLTTILLIAVIMQVSASTYAQKISLSVKNAPILEVFDQISTQTGYNFLFTGSTLKGAKPVTIEVKNTELNDVLEKIFDSQELDFKIEKNSVVVSKKEQTSFLQKVMDKIQARKIEGKVVDSLGIPLSGATVRVKDKKMTTTTGVNGTFILDGVNDEDLIIVSFIGYQDAQLRVGDRDDYYFRLIPATNKLDQVVIQAYGTTTQRLSTGNIATVSAAEIAKQPVMNPLLALQGKVAGLDITQTNGFASAPVSVVLRGKSTIGGFPSDPLYIIDGVPLTVLDINNNSGYVSQGFIQSGQTGPAGGQSPLFSLNPADIESISVLKDADATAIYGSRGANGVILITTKKGKAGDSEFNLNVQQGYTKVTKFWDMLNTQQYLQIRHEAFANDLKKYGPNSQTVPDEFNAYDLVIWDTTRYTDWQRQLYGGTGKSTNAQFSLSGGDKKTTFHISGGYNRVTDITTVSGADQRASTSFNFTHHALNDKLTLTLAGTYSYTQSDMTNLPGGGITYAPNAPSIYDKDGKPNYEEWRVTGSYPFQVLFQPYTSKTNFLNADLKVNYQLAKGLSLSSSFGYNNARADQLSLTPISSLDPTQNPTGSASFGDNKNQGWIIEPQLNYRKLWDKSNLTVLLGGSVQYTSTSGTNIIAGGYKTDDLLKTLTNASTFQINDNYGEYRYAALFSRLTYNYDNKYILNVSARRDGSSKFGAGKQFGNFGSVGAAWLFTEENFVKNNISFLSSGKLRGSYGVTGSDAVGDYRYLSRWSSANLYSYNGVLPIGATQNSNALYQWQETRKLEGAVELGFLKDRININIAYYRNRCGNQLIQYPTPIFTGFNSVTANSPALVENSGWDFLANANIINSKNFQWSLTFNTGINHNKLIAYPDIEHSPYFGLLEVGKSLDIVKVLHYTGVDKQTGLYTYQDKNNDGQISTVAGTTDDRYAIDLAPKFSGGFGSNFTYKNFQLSLNFTVKIQKGRNALLPSSGSSPGTINNQPIQLLTANYWKQPGDNATFAALTTIPYDSSYSYYYTSDASITDASYVRLTNATFAYVLPNNWLKKTGIKSCGININAQNLFVLTKYKGVDPETQNFGGLPPIKAVTLGLNVNF